MSKIFPFDECSVLDIEKCLEELRVKGMVLIAQHNDQKMLLVRNFLKHQSINKPSKTRLVFDTYEANQEYFSTHSCSTPVVVTEDYAGERKGREGKGKEHGREVVPKTPKTGTNELIAFYCELWKLRYKTADAPVITGPVAGRFKELIKTVGLEKAKTLVDAYLQMPDSFFVMKRHDVFTLMGNLNAVTQFSSSGRMISRAELRDLDNKVAQHTMLEALERGEL